MNNTDVAQLLTHLEEEGLLTEADALKELIVPAKRLLYLDVALFVPALFSTLFFYAFLFSLADSNTTRLIIALFFLATGMALLVIETKGILSNMALMTCVVSYGTVLVVFSDISRSLGQVLIVNGLLCLSLLKLRHAELRFIFIGVFLTQLVIWLNMHSQAVGLPLFVFAAMACLIYLARTPELGIKDRPISAALALAMMGAASVQVLNAFEESADHTTLWWLARWGVYLVLAVWLWSNTRRNLPILLTALLVLAILASFTTVPILVALALVLISYATREAKLLGIAILALVLAVYFYYYFLDVSLMIKSIHLVGSGAVLLALAYVWRRAQAVTKQVEVPA